MTFSLFFFLTCGILKSKFCTTKLAGHDKWPMRFTVTGDDLCLHRVQQLKQVMPSLVREGHSFSETS